MLTRRLSGLRRRAATLLADAGVPGVRPSGIYVPYRHAPAMHVAQAGPGGREELAWLRAEFDATLNQQRDLLRYAAAFNERYAEFAGVRAEAPHAPRLDQDWFPGLDAALAYAIVRRYAPTRIVEVGSGHSTRWLAQAIADGRLATQLCSIDPQPRRDIDSLCQRVLRVPLEAAPADVFDALGANDILFIDSSHVALPGTDVDQLLTRTIPRLRAGVLIHVHDVFWPFDYPREWQRRRYNEQLLVATLLAGGSRYRVLAANYYLRQCQPDALSDLAVPIAAGRFESSLWLQKDAGMARPDSIQDRHV